MAFRNQQKNRNLSSQLDRAFQKKVVDQFVEFHKKVAITAWREVTATSREAGFSFGSPLWSGRFRASHNISIGSPNYTPAPENPETQPPAATYWPDPVDSPSRSRTPAEASAVLNAMRPFDKVFIANGVPYSRRIEFDGWSLQAPAGVYQVTAENMRVRFRNVRPLRLGDF